MSDFMKWLYAHSIRPQLDAAPPDDYEMPLSLLEGELTSEMAADYEKAREFTAIHAFLLGRKPGPAPVTPQTPAILDSSGSQAQTVSRYTPRRGSSPASAGAASARAITSSASGGSPAPPGRRCPPGPPAFRTSPPGRWTHTWRR